MATGLDTAGPSVSLEGNGESWALHCETETENAEPHDDLDLDLDLERRFEFAGGSATVTESLCLTQDEVDVDAARLRIAAAESESECGGRGRVMDMNGWGWVSWVEDATQVPKKWVDQSGRSIAFCHRVISVGAGNESGRAPYSVVCHGRVDAGSRRQSLS